MSLGRTPSENLDGGADAEPSVAKPEDLLSFFTIVKRSRKRKRRYEESVVTSNELFWRFVVFTHDEEWRRGKEVQYLPTSNQDQRH